MIRSPLITRQSIATKIRAAARKCSAVAIATAVLLLSAPFVNTTRHEEVLPPPPANPPEAVESRVAVKLRHGDTLMSVLKRYGIGLPSAHALIAKVRPFVNPRKIQPGDNIHVLLNAGDQTVEALEFVVDNNMVRVKATSDGWLADVKRSLSCARLELFEARSREAFMKAARRRDSRPSRLSIWRRSSSTTSISFPISSRGTRSRSW